MQNFAVIPQILRPQQDSKLFRMYNFQFAATGENNAASRATILMQNVAARLALEAAHRINGNEYTF
jgi:hypothetical protein